jgi:hypothetical protein
LSILFRFDRFILSLPWLTKYRISIIDEILKFAERRLYDQRVDPLPSLNGKAKEA